MRGTGHHEAFERWWADTARSDYLGFQDGRPGDEVTFYYDPTIDRHLRLPAAWGALFPSYFLAPQKPDEARALLAAALTQSGLAATPTNLPGPQRTPMIMHLAREWGMTELAGALVAAADARFEPTWDRARGEFTWGFGLAEEHPRGQFNAAMAAAEAMSEGAWWRLFNVNPGDRFSEPTVCGVDFPDLALRQAWWDREAQRLTIATEPRNAAVAGQPTRFTITNLGDASRFTLDDPVSAAHLRVSGPGQIELTTTIGAHRFALSRR